MNYFSTNPLILHILKFLVVKPFFYNNYKSNKYENNFKSGIFLGYAGDSLGYKILDVSTNTIITARDVYFLEDMPGTINTTFFCNKYIDSIIDFKDLLIEGESNNSNDIMNDLQLKNPLNNNNYSDMNNNNNNDLNNNNLFNNNNLNNNNHLNNNNNNSNNINDINNNYFNNNNQHINTNLNKNSLIDNNNLNNNNLNNNDNNKNNINNKRSLEEESEYNNDSDNEPLNLRKEKFKNKYNKGHKVMNIITNVPNTYEQAINSEDSNEWKLAIKEELLNM